MKIVFCCYDFKKENLRLMPWRYIYEIARGLLNKGENVSIFSIEHKKARNEDIIDGIKVYSVYEKDIFNEKNYENILETNDIIIWSSSPRTVFYFKNLEKLNKPLVLLFSGPFYSFTDVMKAQTCQVPFNQLSSHYKNAIFSPKLLCNMINTDLVKKAVVLSEKNSRFLRNKGASASKIMVAPPGYDGNSLSDFNDKAISDMRKATNLPKDRNVLTYMGSLYQIRGVNILIDAFSDVCKKLENILLLILARTKDKTEITRVANLIKKYGLENRIELVSGFLEQDRVADYLYASDAVVLPFILVPSDMPLGALEAMAMGKPVIATDVDGMPEMVRDRGIIVKPGDKDALAKAIITLSQDSSLYNSLKANCVSYMAHYPRWEDVVNRFNLLLHGNG